MSAHPSNLVNQSHIRATTSTITFADRWNHFLARVVGWRRQRRRVKPGLYALGNPTGDSPVFVTANYSLSFDALRSSLGGVHGYILVLDTKGINVWCAAGKGTFGTDELVNRIESVGLREVVSHQLLILPQLGAPGVAAHEVKKRSGFKVEYGPVRAVDLPEYLESHRATSEMRRVYFTLRDRAILIPVEFSLPVLILIALFLINLGRDNASISANAGWIAAILAGVVLFPLLLPWLPTRDFSTKGFVLGGLVALLFVLQIPLDNPDTSWWRQAGGVMSSLLMWPTVTAFLSLNFTGSSTFTSRSGVRREIFRYIPVMAVLFGLGLLTTIVLEFV
jgi:hypothetical protein